MQTFYSLRNICLVIMIFFCALTGIAQTSWTGATSSAWGTKTNWSTNLVPTAADDVIIGNASFTGTSQPAISLVSATAKSITFGTSKLSTLTVNNTLAVSGSITLSSSGTLIQGNSTISLAGNWNNGGTYNAANTSAVTFNGITQAIGGTALSTFNRININNLSTVTLTSDIALNGSTTASNVGVINVATGGTLDLSTFLANRVTSNLGGSFIIPNGAYLKIGGTNGLPSNFGIYTFGGSSTVEYNGTNQPVSFQQYGNLIFSSSSGAAIKTMPATPLSIVGYLRSTVGSGTSVSYTAAASITVSDSLIIGPSTTFNSGNFAHSVGKNWINNGTFVPGTSTITLTGSGAEILGNVVQNFYNLTIAASHDLGNSDTIETNNLSIPLGGSILLDFATLRIAGTVNNSGAFDASTGTLEMNGSVGQTIPANTFLGNLVDNLVINNSSLAGVSLDGPVDILTSLTYKGTGRTFTTNDFLTLKSSQFLTARAGDFTGNVITGNVTIERYVSAHRSWRLLTSPVNVSSSQTIHDAWQEGTNNTSLAVNEDPAPGFGTHITWGNNFALGFDVGVTDNPGIKGYNTLTEAWDALSNTNVVKLTDYPAYMVFVRGDRSTDLSLGLNAPSTPTVLRSSGALNIGPQPTAVSATGFTVVSNPFASAMDLNNVAKSVTSTNIQDNFYVWDPLMTGTNGVGGFVNFSWNGVDAYVITPDPGDGISQFIPSGSAFVARSANGLTPGILVVKESDKTDAGESVNRPATSVHDENLITNLYSINTDGTTSIVDGVRNSFKTEYSDMVDNNDAVKLSNFAENLSTLRDGRSLTVERRKPAVLTDTIFLNMQNMSVKPYKFEFNAENFSGSTLIGFLEDSYLNTSTPIDLNASTTVNFEVTGAPGSSDPNRFMIVFRPLQALPLTFNTVKAFQQNDDIEVQWTIENETGIQKYEIEKSANGTQFTKSTAMLKRVVSSAAPYKWIDENPFDGNNFYRVKMINADGKVQYSSIVKVIVSAGRQGIVIQGNVITNDVINFNLVNMPAGTYLVSVINSAGQLIRAKQIEHAGGSSTQNIKLGARAAKGIYLIEFNHAGDKKITRKVFIR